MRAVLLALLLTLLATSASFGSSLPTASLDEGLPAGAAERLIAGGEVPLILDGTPYPLTATVHSLLAPDAQVGTLYKDGQTLVTPRHITTYIGHLAGSDLNVRLSLDPDRPGVEGLILGPDGTGWLLLPRPDGGADAVPTLGLHRHGIGEEDTLPVPEPLSGGSEAVSQDGTLKLRLALEVQHNYWNLRQSDWESRILEIVSYTELVYTTQLDVVFEITYLMAWEEPDPYTARHACWSAVSPGAEGRLEQFAQYWQQNRQDVTRDAAHLFAAAFTKGSFSGCAYIEALGSYGYGVTRAKHSVYTSREVALWDNINLFAHELGHNFGGYHEKSVGLYGVTGNSALYGLPPHTIMDSGWNGILRFSELDGVRSPSTNWELDNAGHMRAHAEARLGPA